MPPRLLIDGASQRRHDAPVQTVGKDYVMSLLLPGKVREASLVHPISLASLRTRT